MVNIVVSGKPSNFVEFENEVDSPWGGEFTLTERCWTKERGAFSRLWVVVVPKHKLAYALKKAEKGYSVVITGNNVDISEDLSHLVVGLSEISDV